MKTRTQEPDSSDPLKDATLEAVSQLIDPLIQLMFDTGVTVREFTQIARERSVLGAQYRLSKGSDKPNKARIAIITGLPRSEVSRLLALRPVNARGGRPHHPVRRVLAGWFDDTAYLDVQGNPAVLPIFGRRKSFERLVQKHGGGVPVRAMLDELSRIDAIELLPDQAVKARTRIPTMTGLNRTSIQAIGERGRDLLKTLMTNARKGSKPLFEATAVLQDPPPESIAYARREIHQQASSFISGVDGLFVQIARPAQKQTSETKKLSSRIGVTAFYFEDLAEEQAGSEARAGGRRRKNLRRK